MYKYFVSFSYSPAPKQQGFGSTIVEMDRKLTQMEDFNEARSDIEKHYNIPENSAVILNFQLLES